MNHIPGILILNDNKTYGRATNNRLLYRCIPNNKLLQPFLIPYKIKLGFSKIMKNLYIICECREKDSIIIETIGEIDILENFYEYQLYCRNLKIKQPTFFFKNIQPNPELITPTIFIFTIDNPGTIDYDDAFSIETYDTEIKINIYIANVPFILNKYNLWDSFSQFQKRVASIYLPTKKIPLLPTKLSELCSLTAGQYRPSFTLSIYVDKITYNITHHEFKTEFIYISANYIYETDELLLNPYYIQLLHITQCCLKKGINSSNELVQSLMLLMGEKCAEQINNGIYILYKNNSIPSLFPYLHTSSEYILEKQKYIHITSPIRRVIDIINMTQIIINTNPLEHGFSLQIQTYIDNCKQNLDVINITIKSIKKIQTECQLYHLFTIQPIDTIYKGILFDKRETKIPGIYSYSVYLTKFKFIAKIKTHELISEEYNNHNFKLYLFNDEITLKRKIKLLFIKPFDN